MFIPEEEYRAILEKMPILCVDLLIMHKGKCLLLKRDNDPARGQYWFAGGRVRKMESIEKAALRLSREETNLDCEFKKIVSVEETIFNRTGNMTSDVHTVNICCELSARSIESLKINNLHSDYIWVDRQDKNFHNAVNQPLALLGM